MLIFIHDAFMEMQRSRTLPSEIFPMQIPVPMHIRRRERVRKACLRSGRRCLQDLKIQRRRQRSARKGVFARKKIWIIMVMAVPTKIGKKPPKTLPNTPNVIRKRSTCPQIGPQTALAIKWGTSFNVLPMPKKIARQMNMIQGWPWRAGIWI